MSTTYGLRRKYGSLLAGKRHLQQKHKYLCRLKFVDKLLDIPHLAGLLCTDL